MCQSTLVLVKSRGLRRGSPVWKCIVPKSSEGHILISFRPLEMCALLDRRQIADLGRMIHLGSFTWTMTPSGSCAQRRYRLPTNIWLAEDLTRLQNGEGSIQADLRHRVLVLADITRWSEQGVGGLIKVYQDIANPEVQAKDGALVNEASLPQRVRGRDNRARLRKPTRLHRQSPAINLHPQQDAGSILILTLPWLRHPRPSALETARFAVSLSDPIVCWIQPSSKCKRLPLPSSPLQLSFANNLARVA